jgi:PAS domain-containing protein
MNEHELFESVELARNRLTALRARLEKEGAAYGSQEIVSALRDLQEMLDKLQSRYGLLRDILDRTNDVVFAKDRDGRYVMINPQGADMFGKTMLSACVASTGAGSGHARVKRRSGQHDTCRRDAPSQPRAYGSRSRMTYWT